MIINPIKKYIVMRPAKTGSTTLFELINRQTNRQYLFHPGHLDSTYLSEEMKKTFNIYAFYRDPYTRFVSRWQSMKRNCVNQILDAPMFYGMKKIDSMPSIIGMLRVIKQDPSLTKCDVTPELIDSISVAEFLQFVLKKQDLVNFYQHDFYTPNTILFSYENYETNVRDLLNRLGLDSSVDIPRLNSSYNQEVYDKITSKEKRMIIDYYKPEYDYFASRGIYFESNKEHECPVHRT